MDSFLHPSSHPPLSSKPLLKKFLFLPPLPFIHVTISFPYNQFMASTHTLHNDITTKHTNIESPHHLQPPLRYGAFTVPIKRRRTGPLSWLFGIFCALLWTAIITAGLAILIIYLIFRPKFPRLYIADATLNAGHIDTDMGLFLNADLTLLTNFTNPNHKVNIFFNYMELNLYFNDTIIATQGISGFSLRPGESMVRSVHMVTSEVMMRKEDAIRWQKEINQNKIGMEVEGRFRTRSYFVSFLHFTYWLYAHCSIVLSDPPSGVFLSSSCRTKH